MAVLTLNAHGAATPDEAWDRYVRPERWSEWSPQIGRVEASAPRLAAGVTGRVIAPLGVASVDFEVDDVDEAARRWAWTVHRGPVRLHLEHAVRAHGSGAATSLTVDAPLAVGAAYAPLAWLALRRLVAA